jgi:hypothetical protein
MRERESDITLDNCIIALLFTMNYMYTPHFLSPHIFPSPLNDLEQIFNRKEIIGLPRCPILSTTVTTEMAWDRRSAVSRCRWTTRGTG